MTPAGIKDQRDRAMAVAVKLQVAGRPVEAHRWHDVATRLDALLSQDIHVSAAVR